MCSQQNDIEICQKSSTLVQAFWRQRQSNIVALFFCTPWTQNAILVQYNIRLITQTECSSKVYYSWSLAYAHTESQNLDCTKLSHDLYGICITTTLMHMPTSISCRWWTHATHCIMVNVLQTKVDAQCDKLATELNWQRLQWSTFPVMASCRKSPF